MKKKATKLENQLRDCKSGVLDGTMLVIDPSAGSQSSLPGYALFKKGKLVDSGVIAINIGWKLHRRLQQIQKTLQEDFEEVDVLAIEDIQFTNPKMLRAQSTLFKAIGVFLASARYKKLVEIVPTTWKSFLKKNNTQFEDYIKGDEWDAIIMGYCILSKAQEQLHED